jgi:hypothetical protein
VSKPADFQLGLLDFFAVLLPGAIATWLLAQYLPSELQGAFRIEGGEKASIGPWIVFLLTSYALGHFVFMAGSKLDTAYDLWRRSNKPLSADSLFLAASKLRESLTPSIDGGQFSTFKWARTYVGVHNPAARVEIDRFEATSKFFRGMVVIASALFAHFLLRDRQLPLSLGAVLVGVLSFNRFCDQRWKMTEQAYATAIIQHATKAAPAAVAEGAGAGSSDD